MFQHSCERDRQIPNAHIPVGFRWRSPDDSEPVHTSGIALRVRSSRPAVSPVRPAFAWRNGADVLNRSHRSGIRRTLGGSPESGWALHRDACVSCIGSDAAFPVACGGIDPSPGPCWRPSSGWSHARKQHREVFCPGHFYGIALGPLRRADPGTDPDWCSHPRPRRSFIFVIAVVCTRCRNISGNRALCRE